MQFPERIKSIKSSDRVLEIGPGNNPHPRADVLLEKIFDNSIEAAEQRGHTPDLKTDKIIIYYDGDKLPFDDKEFDYIICSHVLEHVVDVDQFVKEILRVASKGYIEYPLIYYEYLYNFKVHNNLLRKNGDIIFWINKNDTNLYDFYNVQMFFYKSLIAGYAELIESNKKLFFEGFEWFEYLNTMKVSDIELVCINPEDMVFSEIEREKFSLFVKVNNVFNKIRNRICPII